VFVASPKPAARKAEPGHHTDAVPAPAGPPAQLPRYADASWKTSRTFVALGQLIADDLAAVQSGGVVSMPLSTGPTLLGPVRGWLTSPSPRLRGSGPAPEDLDEADVHRLEGASQIFREADRIAPGGLRRQAVVGQLYEITELLEYSHPEHITTRLFGTVAELALLVGSVAHEDGLEPTAQKYFVLALHAARQAGDSSLVGEVLSRMARQMVHLGYPTDALELVGCAREASRDSACASVRSLFLLVEAWCYAHLGRADDCHRAVDAAADAFADPAPGHEPPWLSFAAADMVGMAGHAYRVLGESDPRQAHHAEPLLRRALALRDPRQLRDRVLGLIDLSITQLLRGDLDQASATGEEALGLMEHLHVTAYLLDHVRALRSRAERYAHTSAGHRLTAGIGRLLSPPGGGATGSSSASPRRARMARSLVERDLSDTT
jgi:hypothetical protein